MSDKDSAPVGGDGGDLPGSNPSQQTGGQPDSTQPQINPSVLLDNPDFVEGLRRIFQSEKDRGVNRVQKEVKGIREDMARLGEYFGVSPEKVAEVQQKMEMDDALAWYKEQRQALPTEPQGSVPEVSGVIQGILLASGVDKSDPGVREFLASNPGADGPAKLVNYLKTRKQPPASPAGIAAPVGGTSSTGEFADHSDEDLGVMLSSLSFSNQDKAKRQAIVAELNRRDPPKRLL